jgi:DNA-binding transcriptional MerR regulator
MTTYSKKEVAEILKKPERTIQFYVAEGLVVPDKKKRGTAMKFTRDDLMTFAMIEALLKPLHKGQKYKYPLSFIKDVLDALKRGNAEVWKPKRGLVSLNDFYSSDEWGKTKELFLIGNGKKYELHVFPIVGQDTEKYGNFEGINKAVSMLVAPTKVTSLTIIIMSRIKSEALAVIKKK